MSRFKLIAFITLITLAFSVVLVGNALAEEKIKLRTAKYWVKWEQIEVGDQEGHVIALLETKGITTNKEGKSFGDGWVHRMTLLIDTNQKTGLGSLQGYEEVTDRDGNKYCYRTEGKIVSAAKAEGRYTLVKGTGKLEGIRGRGTWVSITPVRGQNYTDEEWDIEIPQ